MTYELKWVCTGLGTCAASFFTYAVPTLQVIALGISIYAGVRALRGRKS